MKSGLGIFENSSGFYLAWWDEEDGEGLRVGDMRQLIDRPEPKNRDDWETWSAEKTLAETCSDSKQGVFYFETRREASAALAKVKLRLKQERALPDWAEKALAQGWKPPKGWKA